MAPPVSYLNLIHQPAVPKKMVLDTQNGSPTRPQLRRGAFSDYIGIARFDHSTKHVFILPGIVLAYVLRGAPTVSLLAPVVVGFLSAVFIASANYVINEWLDRSFDAHHPSKSSRNAVQNKLDARVVYLEYALLLLFGLVLASFVNSTFLFVSIAFTLSGIIYNVSPIRSKDKPFIDVLSESFNNPIRLMLGWAMVDSMTLPPGSLLLCYWMGGAFLMTAKRLSEYRDIVQEGDKELLVRYRPVFKYYTAESLMVACFLYGMLSTFFLAIFLLKYRVEYILIVPAIVTMFAQYMAMALQHDSVAQKPERLFREKRLTMNVAAIVGLLLLFTFVDVPVLNSLTTQNFIELHWGGG